MNSQKRKWCIVPGCFTNSDRYLHRFPKNRECAKKWSVAIGVSRVRVGDRVCSRHFLHSDYSAPPGFGVQVRLKPGSVPSQCLSATSPFSSDLEIGANVCVTTTESTNNATLENLSVKVVSKSKSKQDHDDYCLKSSSKLVRQNQWLLYENDRLSRENNKLRRSVARFKSRWLQVSRDKHIPKQTKDKIVRERLAGKFSKAQLDIALSSRKRKFSKKYDQSDYKQAMSLRLLSKPALQLVRKETPLILPSATSLQRKFGFIHVCPGIIQPVLQFILQLKDEFSGIKSLTALCFDEMNLQEEAGLDTRMDMVIGPAKFAQTVMVRGLAASWKFPVFVDFDMCMTKQVLFEIILALETVGLKVLITTCDQGPKNLSLASKKQLNLGDSLSFANPHDSARKILFSFDFVHVFKNIRNHILDDLIAFEDGTCASRKDFQDLFDTLSPEITAGYKLKDIHLNCKGTDRQNVALAVQLLSGTVSTLFKLQFPDNPVKSALSDFVSAMNNAFDVMNSRVVIANEPMKCALGVHFCVQKQALEKALHYLETVQFNGRSSLPCQKGGKRAILCALELQKILASKYQVPSLMTSHINQDCLESYFGEIRKRGNTYNHPSALEFVHRVGLSLVKRFLKYDQFEVEDLKDSLKLEDNEQCLENDIEDSDLPDMIGDQGCLDSERKWSEDEGIFWIAGFCAAKMKNIDSSLGCYRHQTPPVSERAKSYFTDSMNRGGLSYPTVAWLQEVRESYDLFCRHHPQQGLRTGKSVVSNFISRLCHLFPHRDPNVLGLLSRTLTRIRIRHINSQRVQKSSLRGKLKTVQYAHGHTKSNK